MNFDSWIKDQQNKFKWHKNDATWFFFFYLVCQIIGSFILFNYETDWFLFPFGIGSVLFFLFIMASSNKNN